MMTNNPSIVEQKNKDGNTGFLIACSYGNDNIIKYMMIMNPSIVE